MKIFGNEELREELRNKTEIPLDEKLDLIEIEEKEDLLKEIEDIADTSDIALESMRSIERIINVLSAESKKGISKSAAELLNIAVEDIYDQIDYHPKVGLPSLESFTDHHTATVVINIATEDFFDIFKKIWENLVRLFKRVREIIGNLFSTAKVAVENKQIEKEIKQVEEIKKEADKQVHVKKIDEQIMITDPYFCKMFTIPHNPASVRSVFTVFNRCASLAHAMPGLISTLDVYLKTLGLAIRQLDECLLNYDNLEQIKDAREAIYKIGEYEIIPWFEFNIPHESHMRVLVPPEIKAKYKGIKETRVYDSLVNGKNLAFIQCLSDEIVHLIRCEEFVNEKFLKIPESFVCPTSAELSQLCTIFNDFSAKLQHVNSYAGYLNDLSKTLEHDLEYGRTVIHGSTNFTEEERKALLEIIKEIFICVQNFVRTQLIISTQLLIVLDKNKRELFKFIKYAEGLLKSGKS